MRVAVLGAGIMGSGIGQTAAMAGHSAVVRDLGDRELDGGREAVERSLARFVTANKLTSMEARESFDRLSFTTDLATAVSDADVIIEAVPEQLDIKRALFEEVVAVAPEGALLGTNTSQISITEIGAGIGTGASRLVGMHFFNPPVMMRLVEIIRGIATSDETLRRAIAFAESLGKETVVCRKDSPGFITTRAYAVLRLECLRMLEEGVATVEDIDRALRLGFNFPMGPLELADFNGLDTYLQALEYLTAAYGERFRPTVGLRNLVAAGRLGRKSGSGFYDYREDTHERNDLRS